MKASRKIIKFKEFTSTEKFEKWQEDDESIRIVSIIPMLEDVVCTVSDADKEDREKSNEKYFAMASTECYFVFVTYYNEKRDEGAIPI